VKERWFVWPIVGIVVAKVALSIASLGLVPTFAISGMLAVLSLLAPVPATLTWPLTLIAAVTAALLRGGWFVLRPFPARWRLPAAIVVLASVAGIATLMPRAPRQFPPIVRSDDDQQPPDACAIVGYSTAGGASLRGGYGGVTTYLNERCGPCRKTTGNLTAGGQTLEWARDAYCASEPTFGANGRVLFFGGANDDFFWGSLAVARMFVLGEQSVEQWYASQAPAAAASLSCIDDQIAALDGLMQCGRSRGAELLFLHDFLVTDIVHGRDHDRAAMLARRRTAVEEAGGQFADLLDVFRSEAGVTWFNDYVHPSAVAHERIAEHACALVESTALTRGK
jgi:hypothetical protein